MNVFFPLKNYFRFYWGTSSCIISFANVIFQTREAVGERGTQGRSFLTALIIS